MSDERIPAFRNAEDEQAYLRRVERVEVNSRNAPGADKSWVHRLDAIDRRHFKTAIRIR